MILNNLPLGIQDITKSGDDYQRLSRKFDDLRSNYRNTIDRNRPSPLDKLRSQIPDYSQNTLLPPKYAIDDDLVSTLKNGRYKELWTKYAEEGRVKMKEFNKDLQLAIENDKSSIPPDLSLS